MTQASNNPLLELIHDNLIYDLNPHMDLIFDVSKITMVQRQEASTVKVYVGDTFATYSFHEDGATKFYEFLKTAMKHHRELNAEKFAVDSYLTISLNEMRYIINNKLETIADHNITNINAAVAKIENSTDLTSKHLTEAIERVERKLTKAVDTNSELATRTLNRAVKDYNLTADELLKESTAYTRETLITLSKQLSIINNLIKEANTPPSFEED